MSLVHLEKSVLTFHFKEILEGEHKSHPLTWLGLGVLMLGPQLVPKLRPTAPARRQAATQPPMVAKGITLSQWIAAARQRERAAGLPAALPEALTRSC